MVLYNIVSTLRQNHDIFVIIGEKGQLFDQLVKLGINCIILSNLKREISIKNDIKAYFELKRIVLQLKPDIVASHSSKAGYLSRVVCYNLKIPNVFTAHGWAFTYGVPTLKRFLFLTLEKAIGYFTDHIITVSDFDRRIGLKYRVVSEKRMMTIHNGSPDLFCSEIRRETGEILKAVMVARFQKQKDHLTLFRALKKLKDKPIEVHLIGDGPLQKEFIELAEKWKLKDIIRFYGSSNEVATFLNQADIFLLISNYEGLPLSICEAFSCGLPVIASNVGGVSEMVTNDKNGFLIPRKDHFYLASKINELLVDKKKREKMSKAARRTFEDKFSIEKMVVKTENYYKEVFYGKS